MAETKITVTTAQAIKTILKEVRPHFRGEAKYLLTKIAASDRLKDEIIELEIDWPDESEFVMNCLNVYKRILTDIFNVIPRGRSSTRPNVYYRRMLIWALYTNHRLTYEAIALMVGKVNHTTIGYNLVCVKDWMMVDAEMRKVMLMFMGECAKEGIDITRLIIYYNWHSLEHDKINAKQFSQT